MLTSGEDSGTCAAGTDLSEVLLDFDLMEDLLELFGVLVVASMVAFWDSFSDRSGYCKRKTLGKWSKRMPQY